MIIKLESHIFIYNKKKYLNYFKFFFHFLFRNLTKYLYLFSSKVFFFFEKRNFIDSEQRDITSKSMTQHPG